MMIEQIELAIESLEQRVSYQKQSLEQIEGCLMQNQEIWDHTPSIWPTVGWISSGFGMRRHPLTGKMRMHEGIDIAGVEGTPIHATADGKVIVSKSNRGGYGKVVIIDHGYGYQTVYGHNKVNLVRVGDQVKRGQVIAKLGNTGRSTGPHVHYEVRVAGKTVNPLLYIVPHSTSKLIDDLARH